MPPISSRRALVEAAQVLARSSSPTLDQYEAVRNALAACASEDAGAPVRCIFVAQPVRAEVVGAA